MKREQINRPKKSAFLDDWELLVPSNDASLTQHDEWGENENYENLAHLRFSDAGVGEGFSLRSACPNFYSSDLLWIHALNGDALDFTEGFVAAKDDGVRQKLLSGRTVYGSAEALGLLGIARGKISQEDAGACPLRGTASDDNKKTATPTATAESKDEVVQFESEIGTFQVTAFQDGTGFAVGRSEDGHSITASFLHSFDGAQQDIAYLMLRSEQETSNGPYVQVSLSDFYGNSFGCEVSLLKIPRDSEMEDGISEELLRVPCVSSVTRRLIVRPKFILIS